MSATDDQPIPAPTNIYGDLDKPIAAGDVAPVIPAATVVLLADHQQGVEVLMLRKTSKIAFGGMWVFPGGRVDDADYPPDREPEVAARRAAARETWEEAGMTLSPDEFVWFAHWTPPPSTPRRFGTWFFAARGDREHDILVDGGEIDDHMWINPADALAKHAAGEIDLAPPTWVTLYQINQHASATAALSHLDAQPTRYYRTRLVKNASGIMVALWEGDADYATAALTDAAPADGDRHRLILTRGGFQFEHSAVAY